MKQGLYLISPDTFENAADLLNAVKNFAKDQTVDAFLYTFPDGADKNGHLNVLKKLIPALQAQNIAVLLKDDVDTAVKTGCDGVQVDYAPHLSELRKKIPDIALGVVCSSRHEAMTAGEAGADYIAFYFARLFGFRDVYNRVFHVFKRPGGNCWQYARGAVF